MRSRCDRLREKALTDGSDSPSARAWRIHARSCPDCRVDDFVLRTLANQARNERRHLGQSELARLLAEARRQHGKEQRGLNPVLFAWSLRLACLMFVCVIASMALRRFAPDVETPMAWYLPDAAGGNYAVPLLSPAAEHKAAIREISSGGVGKPTLIDGARSLNLRMRRLRQEVNRRRESLLEIMERDLGEQMRQDVRDASCSYRMLVA